MHNKKNNRVSQAERNDQRVIASSELDASIGATEPKKKNREGEEAAMEEEGFVSPSSRLRVKFILSRGG